MGYGFCSWSMWWKSSCYMEITSCICSLKYMINKVSECFLNAVAANDFGTVLYINLPDPEALLLHTKQGRWTWTSNEQPSVGLEWDSILVYIPNSSIKDLHSATTFQPYRQQEAASLINIISHSVNLEWE